MIKKENVLIFTILILLILLVVNWNSPVSNYKNDSDSLRIVIKTLTVEKEENKVIIEALKEIRNEDINAIDSMDHDELYMFFSNR